jgi:hypothetical protein
VGKAATIRLEKMSPRRSGQLSLEGTYSRIGYFPVLHRDVEVNADKGALSIEINVGNGEFVRERHDLALV